MNCMVSPTYDLMSKMYPRLRFYLWWDWMCVMWMSHLFFYQLIHLCTIFTLHLYMWFLVLCIFLLLDWMDKKWILFIYFNVLDLSVGLKYWEVVVGHGFSMWEGFHVTLWNWMLVSRNLWFFVIFLFECLCLFVVFSLVFLMLVFAFSLCVFACLCWYGLQEQD